MMPKSATGAQGRSGATARPAFTVCVVTAAERTMGSRAVARLLSCAPVAPFGITRRLASCALRRLALSGIRRPYDLRRYGLRRYGLCRYGLRRSGRRGYGRRGYGGGDAGYSSEGFQLCLVIVAR